MTVEFKCLAVDTSTELCGVAACAGDSVGLREFTNSREGSQDIYAAVAEALNEAGIELSDLDCLALGCGPGGFTGLRVGAAAIQALAYGVGKPVCVVSSLAVLAMGAFRVHQSPVVATCFDARMGEAYFAVYEVDDGLPRPRVSDVLVDPATFEFDVDAEVFAAGPGWAAYPEFYDRCRTQIDGRAFDLMPAAADLLTIARRYFELGQAVSAEQALPNYLRENVTQ